MCQSKIVSICRGFSYLALNVLMFWIKTMCPDTDGKISLSCNLSISVY